MFKIDFKKAFSSAKNLAATKGSTGLVVIAIIGVAATAYFASKEAPEAQEKLEEHKDDNIAEKAGVVVGSYPKTIAAAGLTIGAIVGSKWIDHQTIISLSAVAATQFNQLKRQAKAIDKLPDDEKKKVNDEIVKDFLFSPDSTAAIRTGHGNILCLEPLCGQFFYSSADYILNTAARRNNEASKNSDSEIKCNDFYDDLGLNMCDFGEWHAFVSDGNNPAKLDIYFDDGHTPEGIPYLIIRYYDDPVEI